LENFNYPHSRVILELAVVLKSDKAFDKFTQALMAFLSNAQMVDPKFAINPLNPNSKEKNIMLKGEISANMTKLGAHVKISGNGNVFSKQKVWNRDDTDNRSTCKSNKKEEFRDPTVYFTMIVLSEVAPADIIERTTHERARLNGVRLQVKELQFVESETVVTFYKVSKLTPKAVLLAELRKMLLMAQEWAKADNLEEELYDFYMDIDVAIGDSLPEMTLRVVQAKLKREYVSTFTKLSNRAQFACKTWHLEVASKYAMKMKGLVQMAKEYGCFVHYWGVHVHISEVTDITSTSSEAKRQVETTQKHVNYEVSMMAEELVGMIDLDHLTEIKHPTSGKVVARYSLQHVLLNFIKMNDGCPAIAEAHQQDLLMPTHLVVPNMPEAERLIGMISKNLSAFLSHTLKEQGLPNEFVNVFRDPAKQRCWQKCNAVSGMQQLGPLQPRTSAIKRRRLRCSRVQHGLKMSLGFWAKRHATKNGALFNLEDAGSRKTIHDRHREPKGGTKDQVGSPPRKARKAVVDLTTDKGDPASHTSLSSLEGLSSSNEGLHSKASSNEGEDSLSAASSG
jgi:hypothetical protein